MAEPLRRLAPEATIRVLDEIGHYPQLEAPDRVARELTDFIPG